MVQEFSGEPVTIGVFTDIQHANKPDQTLRKLYGIPDDVETERDHLSTVRKYSQTLTKATHAVKSFNTSNVTATLHLGDIIDGNTTIAHTHDELDAVIRTLKPLESPILHAIGNHCLHADRAYLLNALGIKQETYYTYDLSPKWRLIMLDTVDVSVYRSPSHPCHQAARKFIDENPESANAKEWNGTIGKNQKAWLEEQLNQARSDGKLVVICGHIPVLLSPEQGDNPAHVIYDAGSIAALFEGFNDVVKAYFCGHFHQGSYAHRGGVHYVTFESILDSVSDSGSWGLVRFFDDGISIEGHGDMTSRQLAF